MATAASPHDLPPPDAASHRWRVRASAFRDPVVDAQRVAVILGIAPACAARITTATPSVVAHSTTRQDAESIADALRSLGAKVWLEDARSPIPSSIPPPPARASSHPPPPPPVEAAREDSARGRSFWLQIPIAFVAPVLGKGSVLVLATGAAGVLALCTALLPLSVFLLRLGFFVVLGLVAIGLVTTTFERLALASSMREDDEWLPATTGTLPSIRDLCWRGLMLTLLSGFLAGVSYLAHGVSGDPLLVLAVSVVLYAYWPMALTLVSATGSWLGAFDVVRIVRAMAAAPLEYAAVVVLSFVALLGVGLVVLAGLGLSAGAALGGSIVAAGASALVPVFAGFAGVAYLHGVVGYLMGSLVKANSERLAFLAE